MSPQRAAEPAESTSEPRGVPGASSLAGASGPARVDRRTSPGQVIADRYELRQTLGAGAHGEVWEARDAITGRVLAVKLLRAEAGARAARVRREAAALRLLRLPGVVELLDEGIDRGRAFLVMERVRGVPFPAAGQPRAWPVIADAAVGLLEALARVHAAGVIHRDLKPANVLVSDDGRPTLLDFGLSHLESSCYDGLTREDEMIGTPAYLAPEQINGDPATPRTDLYAVGVLLYGALSGRLPHEAADLMGLLRARLTRRPAPLRDVAPEVPAAVAEAVERLLEVEPDARPQSAAEVLGLLRGRRAVPAPALPWLGPRAPIVALVEAALAKRSADVAGAPGSGRTRCLEEVAAALEGAGRRALWAGRGRRALAGLEPVVGSLEGHADERLAAVAAAVEARLRAALKAGAALLVDDAEQIDPTSAEVIARCRGAGAVIRALAAAPEAGGEPLGHAALAAAPEAGGGLRILLAPLSEEDLRALFSGPDRLLHLREDAARALLSRTEGLPARVAYEVTSWVRAGVARRAGARLAVDRDAIERLDAGSRVSPPPHDASTPSLPQHLDDLLMWVSLVWPRADIDRLRAITGHPTWRIEAELDELVALGGARRLPGGAIQPARRARAEDAWPPERARAAHLAVAAAQPPGEDGRLWHLIAGEDEGGSDPAGARAIAREALDLARRLAREGRLGRASAALGEGLRAARRARRRADPGSDPPRGASGSPGDEPVEVEILSLWLDVALAEWTPTAVDQVLYELCRAASSDPRIAELEGLARAALALGADPRRALRMAAELPEPADPSLALRLQGLRMVAARSAEPAREAEELAAVTAWAERRGDAASLARLAGWTGRFRYRQGRFDEAAALHARAAEGEAWLVDRVAARLNEASALLEAFRHDEAEARARGAGALARACRQAFFEARAAWIVRAAAYRRGDRLDADVELADAIGHLGARDLEALVCATEAAVAWRAAAPGAAIALARRAIERWSQAGLHPEYVRLMRCLQIACGEPATDAEVERLARESAGGVVPGMGAQSLGLLGRVRPAVARALAGAMGPLTAAIPRRLWGARIDVLSIDEAYEGLGAAPPPPG